jgi:putative nucleotidyltransferase with HDIG domain
MTQYVENYSYPYKQRGSISVARTNEKLTGLSRLSHFLVGSDTIEELLERATGYILDLLHIDYCRIFILQPDGHYQLQLDHQASAEAIDQVSHLVSSSSEIQRPSSLEQILNFQCREALGLKLRDCHWIIPLSVEKTSVGMLVLAKRNSTEFDAFPRDAYYLVDLIVDQLGNALHRKQLNEQLENSSIETVLALSKTLETRDAYSGAHSKRLATYSEQLAHHFNLSARETRELCWAALLHDIGKIGIEDQILHKPGPLTAREWEVMKSHSEVGAQIVTGLSGLENIALIILSHHERVDGNGYPHRLKGDQIPLGARIIAVVDSYSAMTEGRVYRTARTHEEAIFELKNFSGKMYDPEVVQAFISIVEKDQND